MWDMSDEHRIICKDSNQSKLYDETAKQLSRIEDVLKTFVSFRNTSFAVDVFELDNQPAEKVIKANIEKYYSNYNYEPKPTIEEEERFFKNDIFGVEKEVNGIEGALKEAFRFYQMSSQSTITFTYDVINEYEYSIREAAAWVSNNYKCDNVRCYNIAKECLAFNSVPVKKIYLGIVYTGSYIVLDDYVILVVFGSCD